MADKQVWFCERCRQIGCVRLPSGVGIDEAVAAIGRSHRQDAAHCPTTAGGLRAINPALISSEEVLLTHEDIPEWVRAPAALFLFGVTASDGAEQ